MTVDLLTRVINAHQGLQVLRALNGGDQSGQRSIHAGRIGGDADQRIEGVHLVRGGQAMAPRFPRSRTHKASSAEAILAHVLKRRGWTAAFRAGMLSHKRRLILLGDIRQYGRRWLRHEAEAFFGEYGDARSEFEYLIDELDHLNYRDLLKLKAEIEEQLKTFAEVYRMVSFPLSGDGSTEPASSPES